MRVLVTGGSGFVGRRLRLVQPDWIYVSSRDFDLTTADGCRAMFERHRPEAVVHLAARVGGIQANVSAQGQFFYDNAVMGLHLVHQAHEAGVARMLLALSTCAWPDVVARYPFTEDDLLNGAPAPSNFGYGEAKRALFAHAVTYRRQYGADYSCFAPSNLYGPEDNFDPQSSHFVPALIRKVAAAADGATIEMWGTGRPLRQQLFIDDLCAIIPLLLERHHSEDPVIVAPDENLSIAEMCDMLVSQTGKRVRIAFNQRLDGQFRKDGSNERLRKLIGEFRFTPFRQGVKRTYDWYNQRLAPAETTAAR